MLTCLTVLHTYLTRKPLVPAAAVEALRLEVKDLRNQLSASGLRIAALEGQLGQAIMEREWWQEQYRAAKEALDKVRASAPR